MSSEEEGDRTIDLDRDLPVTRDDVDAQRRVRDRAISTAEYIELLNAMSKEPSRTEITAWEPFVLPAGPRS